MIQSSARDEALVVVGQSRGLVRRDQLDRILAGAGASGLAHGLRSALTPEQLAALQDAARRTRFICARACVTLGFDDLASLASLACPRCGGDLRPIQEPPHPAGAHVARPSDRHEPKIIGGYEVVEELGRGSFGVVYKVRRPGLARPFALKVLLRADQAPDLMARFRLEAQIASKLEHPGIVGVFDAGMHGEWPYLVMDYCQGQTLQARLKDGPLPPLEAARLVAEVARAVAFAHERGVLHRDLKPANIILDAASGRPRVTDFGLARDRSLAQSMTRTGDVVGTPAYAAPEQLRGEKRLDERVDVWALGVILYECLAGQRPFVGADVVSVVEQVLHGPIRPPRELRPDVPEALEEACLRALERERFKRTASAVALADELEAIVRTAGATRPRRRRPRRRPWPAALAAGVVLAGVAGGVASALRSPPATEPPTSSTTAPPSATEATPPPIAPDAPASEAPPSVASEAPPAPPPAPRAERAPDEEVEPLLAAAERMLRLHERRPVDWEAMDTVMKLGPAMAERYPADGRAVFVGAYAELFLGKDELAVRRALVRSMVLDPPPPDALRDRAARLCFALGFQRAAADLLEPVVAGRDVDARQAHHLTLIVGKSSLPVRDLQRALQLARRALDASDADYAGGDRRRDQPPAWEVRRAMADLLLFHGDKDRAVALLREASMRARRNADELAGEAARLEATPGIPASYEAPLRSFGYDFPVTPFLQGLAEVTKAADEGQDRAAAVTLEGMARRDAELHGPERTALALLAAARLYERMDARAEALRTLEEAAAIEQPAHARDVRALVRRALARALLDGDPARAERLALEAAAAAEDPACTPGERADAWVLVGFARRARGDLAGVRDALAKVAEQAPADVRWAEALRDGRPLALPPSPGWTPAPEVARPEAAVDLDALLQDAARVIRIGEWRTFDDAALTRLVRAAPGLVERARTDGRAAVVVALAALLRGEDELEARRGLIRALRAAPDVPPGLRDRAARLCHALGFERAAADLLEALFTDGPAPPAEQALCLAQAYMKSAPPVQDVDRSIELLRRLLSADAGEPRDSPGALRWELLASLGELLLSKRDPAGAAPAYREAASLARDPRARAFLTERAEAVAADAIDWRAHEVPGRFVTFVLPVSDFLRRLAEPRVHADREGAERQVAPALADLAKREAGQRPERAVLALVAAARLLERVGDVDQAVRLLEDAAAVSLPERAVDVRALLARTLARVLVERDPERAERLALEAAGVPDDAPLTPGERADAWVVVARARKARGDAAGAREARDRALTCGPFDRRGVDSLRD